MNNETIQEILRTHNKWGFEQCIKSFMNKYGYDKVICERGVVGGVDGVIKMVYEVRGDE